MRGAISAKGPTYDQRVAEAKRNKDVVGSKSRRQQVALKLIDAFLVYDGGGDWQLQRRRQRRDCDVTTPEQRKQQCGVKTCGDTSIEQHRQVLAGA